MKLTKQQKIDRRNAYAKAAEDAANKGHYLDRLENIAIALDDRDSQMADHESVEEIEEFLFDLKFAPSREEQQGGI